MKTSGKVVSLCLFTLLTSPLSVLAATKASHKLTDINSKYPHDLTAVDNHIDHNCQTDHNGQNWSKLQSQFNAQMTQLKLNRVTEQLRNDAISGDLVSSSIAEDGRYYIPVVFHIYGEAYNCADATQKCLTDDKVRDALRKLNDDFQGLAVDSPQISPIFSALRKNVNIEFVLPKKDPTGRDTNGIVRYDREEAGYGNHDAQTLSRINQDSWDNFKYMNVYIMNDLHANGKGNNSGIAWYPEVAMSEAGTARVVYNGNYVGNNTNENFRSVLTHEFGHWLNLIHTFEDKQCTITNQTLCESTGDRNCDTPQMSLPSPMQDNAPNCFGEPTNTENFMHYSDNYAMFTADQVARITAALHGPSRRTLWSNDNLIATGLEEYVSNADHPWDGISGIDVEPEGTELMSFDNISGLKGDINTFEINLPDGANNILFYLNGHTEDPDMYLSKGVVPTPPPEGSEDWIADFTSFNSPGDAEVLSIDEPDTTVPYYASVHAFSEFSNSKLQVIQADDPFLKAGERRFTLLKIDDLWANKTDGMWTDRLGKTHDFQFNVPEDASRVVVVVPGGYQGPKMADGSIKYNGDLDLYVSKNSEVSRDSYDCRPFTWKGIAEYCEFDGGGKFDLLIDPFQTYTKASLHVYYETSNTANQLPFANTNGKKYEEALGHAIEFSSANSNDPDGNIISYAWDFGDGNSSVQANPSHIYNNVGSYPVKLTVTDNSGASVVGTTTAVITENSPNDAELCTGCSRFYLNDEIKLSALAGSQPRNYEFAVPDAASLVTYELVSRYNGDPDIHVSQNKSVSKEVYDCRPWEAPGQTELCQFTSGGIFNVMIDPFLNYDSLRFRAYYDIRDDADHSAPNRLPTANAGGEYVGRATYRINFDGGQSRDEDGQIVDYSWNFGHGVVKAGQSITHTYPQAGTYFTTLTVTDNDGATHENKATVTILPIGDIDNDGDVDIDDIAAFNAALNNNDPIDSSFDINGDGRIDAADITAIRELCSYNACTNIPPPPQAPIAIARALQNDVQVSSSINFSSQESSDQYGQIVTYDWDFGDGTRSDFANPTHQYAKAGIYEVILSITDNDDMTSTARVIVNIDHPPLVSACDNAPNDSREILPSAPRCIENRKAFSFNNLNSGHTHVAITLIGAPDDALIYFGDGNWPKTGNGDHTLVSETQGDQQCIYYTIPADANYWGYIEVSGQPNGATIVMDYDVPGCRPLVNDIPKQAPHADIVISGSVVNEHVAFSAANSYDSDGHIVSYFWDFGDGTTSTQQNPVHAYSQLGLFDVTLTVTDNDGLVSSTSKSLTIAMPALTDACSVSDADKTTRDLLSGEARCIGNRASYAFRAVDQHQSVAITMLNASADAQVYFKNGGRPSIPRNHFDAKSVAQGEQQCLIYDIPSNARYWGYIDVSGISEGATIVMDFDTQSCRTNTQ
ncbi:PKD domain-containing protein [Pseudoalteromonas sp. MMG013]|uniref:PKD domain-containing protein n=1 Tax=Pseudoalteromonas sp. MMG013 TaxID=2822687 RepID=UPI001B387C1E|nr:PKD domain-containing protein [Pseudoalteromonas sp. MMG013]MBQ4860363.1 PKD domain-containing protein [Pseudoalteromonas sp. MMG013]